MKVFLVVEEIEAESANVWVFSDIELARKALVELCVEAGFPDATPSEFDEFCKDEYWVRIEPSDVDEMPSEMFEADVPSD